MEVTEQGKRFYAYARKIRYLVEEAIRETVKGKDLREVLSSEQAPPSPLMFCRRFLPHMPNDIRTFR